MGDSNNGSFTDMATQTNASSTVQAGSLDGWEIRGDSDMAGQTDIINSHEYTIRR